MPTESRNQRRPVYLRFPERYEYLPKRINNMLLTCSQSSLSGKKEYKPKRTIKAGL